MTLLEVITKASSGIHNLIDHESDYPVVLNPEPIVLNLKAETDASESKFPLEKFVGWEISEMDNELIELGRKFSKKLNRSLQNKVSFGKGDLLDMLSSYLVRLGKKVGITSVFGRPGEGYACEVVEKLGFLMVKDIRGLVLEGCLRLDVWSLLECLIIKGFVERLHVTNLISRLIEKRKSEYIVLCVKHLDLQAYDLMCILKYFLVLPSDGYNSLVSIRKHWDKRALSVIDMASKNSGSDKEMCMLKEAALLIMLAYDQFSVTDLCLHYLLSSPNFDHVIFSACVGHLSFEEMKALIEYLGKWIRKYNSFPQVVPCPKASSEFGMDVCDWIPTLEHVVKCLSMAVDEHFSLFVMHSEFHVLLSLGGVVSSLAAESKLCANLASLIEHVRIENQDEELE